MKNRFLAVSLVGVLLGVAILAAGCGKSNSSSSSSAPSAAQPLPASSCSAIQNPSGQYLIASDLPLQGAGRSQTIQMTQAIAYILSQDGWKAGDYTLAYQSCDDATAQTGSWDSGKVSQNANAYAADPSVIGVIGTFNSGAAEIMIPVLNQAPNGPIAMISPANTYVGLTHSGPGTAPGEPDKYYPSGTRNYTRVVAADDYQGAADAELAQKLGHKSVYVLNDKQAYGQGVATNFSNAAKKLGITIPADDAFSATATSYESLAVSIKASGATAVFIGGLICENGAKLVKDIKAENPNIQVMLPDGFTPVSAVISGAGSAAEGATVSVAGLPNDQLPQGGQDFVTGFSAQNGGTAPEPYSVYAAQAADVLVEAIKNSDGTRADVSDQMFKVDLKGSILGDMSFNANGDVSANPVTIYQVKGGKQVTNQVIVPDSSLVASA